MNKILIFLMIFLLVACASERKTKLKSQREHWEYSSWNSKFKDRAICLCVLYGQNNASLIEKISNNDRSFRDPLSQAIFDSVILTNLKKVIVTINTDSIYRIGRVAEALKGKHIFSTCLRFYKSKTLDSITRNQKRYWKSIKDIDTIIKKKVPDF
ncbi:MAG: hypothetical protein CFE24_06880 [Flavobacterium sp. BFFFF2]|nr:MAG: hypothetical protein CFE24_06880 [Flavobacterium sp. BFFFF2]